VPFMPFMPLVDGAIICISSHFGLDDRGQGERNIDCLRILSMFCLIKQ
jgi:hypothetical protein